MQTYVIFIFKCQLGIVDLNFGVKVSSGALVMFCDKALVLNSFLLLPNSLKLWLCFTENHTYTETDTAFSGLHVYLYGQGSRPVVAGKGKCYVCPPGVDCPSPAGWCQVSSSPQCFCGLCCDWCTIWTEPQCVRRYHGVLCRHFYSNGKVNV